MSALEAVAVPVCACGSTHLCECGCGEELNPNVRRVHELMAAGASTAQAAKAMSVSTAWVKSIKNGRGVPRYVKGHLSAKQRENGRLRAMDTHARNRAHRERSRERSLVLYVERALPEEIETMRSTNKLIHHFPWFTKIASDKFPGLYGKWLAERERIRAEREAERERIRAVRRSRWRPSYTNVSRPWSLDAPVGEPGGADFYDIQRLPSMLSAADEVLSDEASLTLHQIVGDMTPDDVQRMRPWDLERLRDRLAAAGLAPDGVQDSERERLRTPERHTNVGKAPLIPGKKKRRQKIEHKAANRVRGNSNRPSQKQRKRWTRDPIYGDEE